MEDTSGEKSFSGRMSVHCCFAFCALYVFGHLIVKGLHRRFVFFRRSNFLKVFVFDFLQGLVYYRPFGRTISLSLDSPSAEVLAKREKGYAALKVRLERLADFHIVDPRVTDCRVKKVKVLCPILKELECLYPNLVVGSDGKTVTLGSVEHAGGNSLKQLYLSADAVRTLPQQYYDDLNKVIQQRHTSSPTRHVAVDLNPEMQRNFELLAKLTGMDKFRYALSGSEAVDSCIKDVRLSTGKKYIVRFAGAYHGHTSGVDSFDALGENHNMIYLKEMDPKSVDFIETYHHFIAGVIVNPMMHFTGVNKMSPAGEKMTMGDRKRETVSREQYGLWLHSLNNKCKYCTKFLTPVAFILDDIYFALRVPELFSFRYFVDEAQKPLEPDVVILGKGVAAGFYPMSVVCAKKQFGLTYDTNYLLKVNKVVGTLAGYQLGLIASNAFLEKFIGMPEEVDTDVQRQLASYNAKFNVFASSLNEKLASRNLPIRVRNFANTFSVNFLNNSLYNSMFVQYLIANGVYVSNQSTGKFNLLPDLVSEDSGELEALSAAFVEAAEQMNADGFFEAKRKVKWLFLAREFIGTFAVREWAQILEDKRIDIDVSHNHPVNRFVHFYSSLGMICFSYVNIFVFGSYKTGFLGFLFCHVLRQAGHFFYEKQDRDHEKRKFGHKDGSKKRAVAGVGLSLFALWHKVLLLEALRTWFVSQKTLVWMYVTYCGMFSTTWQVRSLCFGALDSFSSPACSDALASYGFFTISEEQLIVSIGMLTVLPHFADIVSTQGWLRGWSWFIKIVTDPFTDLYDFHTSWKIPLREFLNIKSTCAKYELNLETKEVSQRKLDTTSRRKTSTSWYEGLGTWMCLPVIWTLSLIFQHLVTFTLVTLAALVFQLARRTDSMMKPAPYRVLATGALEQEVRPWFVAVFHVIVFEWRVVGTDTRLFHWLSAFLNATLAKWDVPFEKLGVNSEHYVQKYCRMFKIPQEPWVWAKPASEYLTMNDWFARKYAAPFDPESNLGSAFISSPSTSVVMWFASVAAMPRLVKNERFTIDESGIPNHEDYLAYPCAIMYLAPADYHCYHSPIDGIVRSCDLLGTDGYSVTVKPYIFEHINILARNRRAVIVVESDAGLSGKTSFRVALVIVGGVTVDSIRLEEATRVGARVFRGQLLGCFARGGSAVAMFFNRDVALADSCAAVRSEGLDFKIDVGRDLANLA